MKRLSLIAGLLLVTVGLLAGCNSSGSKAEGAAVQQETIKAQQDAINKENAPNTPATGAAMNNSPASTDPTTQAQQEAIKRENGGR